jgi:hypothetical protein
MDTTRPPSYDPVMQVCGRCGEDNPERARFCLACAAPLTDAVSARREERKRVSVLFCDLVGFTSRAERLDVEDVRGLLAPTTSGSGPTWSATAGRWRSSSATP